MFLHLTLPSSDEFQGIFFGWIAPQRWYIVRIKHRRERADEQHFSTSRCGILSSRQVSKLRYALLEIDAIDVEGKCVQNRVAELFSKGLACQAKVFRRLEIKLCF